MSRNILDISKGEIELRLSGNDGVSLERLSLPNVGDFALGGPLFGVSTSEGWVDGKTVEFTKHEVFRRPREVEEHVISAKSNKGSLEVEIHIIIQSSTPLIEIWSTIRNVGDHLITINRIDSVSLDLVPGKYEVCSFRASGSCTEFAPVAQFLSLESIYTLGSLSGRSSNGDHPYFVINGDLEKQIAVCVAWSGNWTIRFEPMSNGAYRLSGGLHDEGFSKTIAPGESISAPPIVLALGQSDPSALTAALAKTGRERWYPEVSENFPLTEWNHWWPYIDQFINEEVFIANVDAAVDLGLEICTLDAGWYGSTELDSNWVQQRGDWDLVNTSRFPRGLRVLSDYTHSRGLKFGLWCEIEALGEKAQIAKKRTDFPALRDGKLLGYLCLGNPVAKEYALATLDRLIAEYACDWVKIDFNIDPGLGCNRTDHGHGIGDGLFDHYMGLYEILDEIRRRYPDVTLENCSSGGLRIDLGMSRRTHISYLSDPDWPEHSLQVSWAAFGWLSPERCLHWVFSQWWHLDALPHQKFDPTDPALTNKQLDYFTRISMLHGFGLSQRLPDLPKWVSESFRSHIALYKKIVRPHIKKSEVLLLTEQPLREGEGDRWAAFQYVKSNDEHLLFTFRLDGATQARLIKPGRLDSKKIYLVTNLGDNTQYQQSGKELLEGILFDTLLEQDSSLLRIAPVRA